MINAHLFISSRDNEQEVKQQLEMERCKICDLLGRDIAEKKVAVENPLFHL